MSALDIFKIIGFVLLILAIFLILATIAYTLLKKGIVWLSTLLWIIIILFIYIILYNLLEPELQKRIVIKLEMKIFDYIWYTIFAVLILFVSAALIHSLYISSELIVYFITVSVGIALFLIMFTIIYRIYENRNELGKIIFISTAYAILLTFILLFLNKILPAHIVRIFYVIYALFIFFYVCCFIILICKSIYDLIVNPKQFENYFNNIGNINIFGKLNANAFKILSI